MNLLDILGRDCVRAPLVATDKRAAIDELVDMLSASGRVRDPAALKAAVWTREQTRTTGIGHGLAIPHGKSPGLDGLAMAIGKPASPLEFEAIDRQPVRLIVLLASPPDRTSEHIQALALVSRLFVAESCRERAYAAETADDLYELLRANQQPA